MKSLIGAFSVLGLIHSSLGQQEITVNRFAYTLCVRRTNTYYVSCAENSAFNFTNPTWVNTNVSVQLNRLDVKGNAIVIQSPSGALFATDYAKTAPGTPLADRIKVVPYSGTSSSYGVHAGSFLASVGVSTNPVLSIYGYNSTVKSWTSTTKTVNHVTGANNYVFVIDKATNVTQYAKAWDTSSWTSITTMPGTIPYFIRLAASSNRLCGLGNSGYFWYCTEMVTDTTGVSFPQGFNWTKVLLPRVNGVYVMQKDFEVVSNKALNAYVALDNNFNLRYSLDEGLNWTQVPGTYGDMGAGSDDTSFTVTIGYGNSLLMAPISRTTSTFTLTKSTCLNLDGPC